jgi:hypothetical protein
LFVALFIIIITEKVPLNTADVEGSVGSPSFAGRFPNSQRLLVRSRILVPACQVLDAGQTPYN